MSLKTTKPLQYGESKAVEGIDGLELLLKEGHKEEEEDGWEGWEIEEVGSGHEASSADEDDEWMSIASDEASKPPPETLQILTDEDFARIKALKRQREAPTQGQNDSEDSDAGEFVNESTIIGFQKRPKKTAEERLESVMAGREGREKFGSKKGTTERVSKNNKEKNKNKAFMMVMHKKTSRKNKMSLREKQKALRKHAIGQKKRF
jgi:protein SDA1